MYSGKMILTIMITTTFTMCSLIESVDNDDSVYCCSACHAESSTLSMENVMATLSTVKSLPIYSNNGYNIHDLNHAYNRRIMDGALPFDAWYF